jgi:hypothetical protein
MVVAEVRVEGALVGMSVREFRDRFGALTLAIKAAGQGEQLHPPGVRAVGGGEVLTLQSEFAEYQALRRFVQ